MQGEAAVPLWRNRAFSVFWLAQGISFTGTQVTEFAVPLTGALVLGASAAQMGVLSSAETLPPLVFGLVAGVVVDRVRRAPLLVWCGLGQGLALATVPLAAWLGVLTLPQLIVVAFVAASLALLYGLAAPAYVPVIVDRTQLAAANSAMTLSDTVPSVVGPGLAGVLVQLLTAPIAVAADAVSFAVAAVLLLATRQPEPAPVAGQRLVHSIREGLADFLREPGIWAPTAALGTSALFYGGILALYILYLVRELRLTPALLGLVLAVATFGPVLAAVLAPPVTRRFGRRWPSVAAGTMAAANLLVPLAGGPLWLVIIALVLARGLVGLGAVFLILARLSLMQETLPSESFGRVSGIVNVVEWAPLPIGSLIGGVLGQALGLRPALVVLAVGSMASMVWVLLGARRTGPAAGPQAG